MHGILYTINKLGESLAATEQALAVAQQENEQLRARVAELDNTEPATNGNGQSPTPSKKK